MEKNYEIYHSAKDWESPLHTFDLELSDNRCLTFTLGKGHTPSTVTRLLISMNDLSINKAAICLSSILRERDFPIVSHGHALITPPSCPDHNSPVVQNCLKAIP